MEENTTNNTNITSNTNNTNGQNQSTYFLQEIAGSEEIFPSLIEIPILRAQRRQRRRRLPHFDFSEGFETMHQNIFTIQNLMGSRQKYDDKIINETKTITPYDFTKVKYEIGQWVDVKDTVGEWLEAQVMQVRNNQAYVHYNGWGTRWDEWIDFSSPRMAAFKTYTLQSPSNIFLSPYPSIACDANVEPQHRTIDSFYYMDKSVNYMGEICKMVDLMGKLRKKNMNMQNVQRIIDINKEILINTNEKSIKKDDFDENKINLSTTQQTSQNSQFTQTQSNLNNYNNFTQTQNSNIGINHSPYDYEILFLASQLIPLMDRCGRLLSDISVHLSHLILNPNLYPQLLLGYNSHPNVEFSDTLSCTSGYSMYTNEGSTISGFNNLMYEQNIAHNLQNNRGNIQNSNQMISNYHQNNNNSINNQININSTSTTQNNNINAYNINSTSELPNIQKHTGTTNQNINSNNNINNNNSLNQNNFDTYPKINLQVSSMLSPGEVMMLNGYNTYTEPNVDILVHTVVSPSTQNGVSNNQNVQSSTTTTNNNRLNVNNTNLNQRVSQNTNQNSNTSYLSSILNSNTHNNSTINNPNNVVNNNNNTLENNNELINNLNNNNTINSNNLNNNTINTTTNNQNTDQQTGVRINNLLENLISIIGSNRRGSTASDTSNTSNSRININNPFINHNSGYNNNSTNQSNMNLNNINVNTNVTNNFQNVNNQITNNNNPFFGTSNTNYQQTRRSPQGLTGVNNTSNRNLTNENLTTPINLNACYKDNSTQTAVSLNNLLSLYKDHK